jgi:small-conductance mechanosensitive channel
MEVGNWVDADQSTGRLIHLPNGLVFTHQVANYTEGFEYIWHEIPVLITFESDRHLARSIIEAAVRDHAPDVERAAGSRIRQTARTYHIKIGALTPIVYLSVKDSGVLLTCRFLVEARAQRDVAQGIWGAILDGLDAAPTVDLAYPTVRTYLEGSIPIVLPPDGRPGDRQS